ncbi:uncharacterized protein LOC143179383 isoform X5 [Calliopsis andreniformis]|uniref:uncharacterized protein LOC143179383 isoform X5 n=1 Tax=Calliopsis andreniformis TaxID=337506 RepID=UPI003FCE4C45
MVYESDFYTTRRPYSRPLVSSYSVTDRPITLPLSTILQLRGIPRMPYVAHKRLVTVIHMPYHTVYHGGELIPIRIHARVRPSVLAAELYRIRNLTRPSTASYLEKYLQSKDHIYFDDEAKEIRARVDSLMRRVHVFVPRAVASDFVEEIVPERMRSGDYVRRLISGKQNAKKDPEPVSWYEVPERGNFGNLACVKYVAGKPQSVRRPYFRLADLRPSDIKNDVNFLSYYKKNRQAADNALKHEKEEALKKIEQYLAKAAEEARSTEERKAAAEEERLKLELEEQKAWEALQAAQERLAHIDEIREQEKAVAERQAEEEKVEADRLETERLQETERQLEEARVAALLEEQQRMIVEEHLAEVRQQEEKEERLANIALEEVDEVKEVDHSRDDAVGSEITDQEREEKPYELIADDDTRIEEENTQEEEHFDLAEDPFVEEPEGAENKAPTGANAIEETPKIEEVTSGGEESFEWGNEDA